MPWCCFFASEGDCDFKDCGKDLEQGCEIFCNACGSFCQGCRECHLNFFAWLSSSKVAEFFWLTFCCTFPISIPLCAYSFVAQLIALIDEEFCGSCCYTCCCLCLSEDSSSSSTYTSTSNRYHSDIPDRARTAATSIIGTTSFTSYSGEASEISAQPQAIAIAEDNCIQRAEAFERERHDIVFSDTDNKYVYQLMKSDDRGYRKAGKECFDSLANATMEVEDIQLRIKHFGSSPELNKQLKKAADKLWYEEHDAKYLAKQEKKEREKAKEEELRQRYSCS